jgi:fructan beta-fructosidase
MCLFDNHQPPDIALPKRSIKSRRVAPIFVLFSVIAAAPVSADDSPDIVIADFEGDTYGGWVAAGNAFGSSPARGTLPGQMAVSGYLGHGLVNSFLNGDASTGTLTSPPFRIERPYLNFLVGGGAYQGSTCIDLLIDGKIIRTKTGLNDRPGGSERLDWASWDVRDFIGRTATLRIVDHETVAWGHINVDQIVQSDRQRGVGQLRRKLFAESRYLLFPVRGDAPLRRVRVWSGQDLVREFDIKLAEEKPQFEVFLDLEPMKGQTLILEAPLPAKSQALNLVSLSPDLPDAGRLYREPGRPQFHFTSRRGWLNDPNGLVWYEGEYHLFYQHNPYGWDWGNMHWGHAVSPDLVHWNELPIALYPKTYGDWCFSGSAVVDSRNTSGLGSANEPPLVLAFTSTGRGECIAYSNDRGRSWNEYAGNPVIKHAGRDPRILWYEPTKHWVMAVYDETGGTRSIAFHSSPDFKTWKYESKIDGYFECPELFDLAVEGHRDRKLWVLYAADGEYQLGRFDGHRFQPDTAKQRLWYGNFYASQSFSNAPDHRRIQIGWARDITFPSESFNQQMTVPCELKLRKSADRVRLVSEPVTELASLRRKEYVHSPLTLGPGTRELPGASGDLLEIDAIAEVGDKGVFSLRVRGTAVAYDATQGKLSCGDVSAPLAPVESVVRLHILLDRGSIEVFANDGCVAISRAVAADGKQPGLWVHVPAARPPVRLRSLKVHELASAWR